MGNQIDMSRIGEHATDIEPFKNEFLKEGFTYSELKLLTADLHICIHSWQLSNALQEKHQLNYKRGFRDIRKI